MRLFVVLAAVLGLWLQAMMPASEAMAAPQAVGLAAFCGHATPHPTTPGPFAHDHRHCLLCQAGAVVAILPPVPRVPLPARTVIAIAATSSEAAPTAPFHAYASRAPPEFG